MTQPRAADDFAMIRARMEELCREREAAHATENETKSGPPQPKYIPTGHSKRSPRDRIVGRDNLDGIAIGHVADRLRAHFRLRCLLACDKRRGAFGVSDVVLRHSRLLASVLMLSRKTTSSWSRAES